MEIEEIRCAFKMFHMKEFTVQERHKILKLLTRKTLFNNQHKKIFPSNRPGLKNISAGSARKEMRKKWKKTFTMHYGDASSRKM